MIKTSRVLNISRTISPFPNFILNLLFSILSVLLAEKPDHLADLILNSYCMLIRLKTQGRVAHEMNIWLGRLGKSGKVRV